MNTEYLVFWVGMRQAISLTLSYVDACAFIERMHAQGKRGLWMEAR